MFNFETDFKKLDERSVFANKILKLIYEKHDGNLDDALKEAEPYFNDLEYFVSNIYELVETQIPLYAYFRLLKYGAENFGLNEIEYQETIGKTIDACVLYYFTPKEPFFAL
jgi:hypothetical protein